MKTSLLCLLLVGLAPLAESRAPRPAEFKGTDATFAALTDALGKPKSQFPEFLRSGESLPMGKLMRSRTGNWWAVIAETGVFELYQLGHDGAFYGPLAPMPSGPWLNTPVMNKVFKLSQCHLDMRANGNLVMAYEHAMGARTQKSEFLVKAGPQGRLLADVDGQQSAAG